MPSIITIQGADLSSSKPKRKRRKSGGLGATGANNLGATVGDCKCVFNPRNKRWAELCYVGKSAKSRTGWKFVRGGAERCKDKGRR